MEMTSCTIKLHGARSSEGRVIWPDIRVGSRTVQDLESLREAVGENVRIEWALVSQSGARSVLLEDDPRIENGGMLLRISEREARHGVDAECVLILDDKKKED